MDDFSFPTNTQDQDSQFYHLPFPHFTTSPLWFIPSVAPLEKSAYYFHRRSLSDPEKYKKKIKEVDQDVVDDEKMDMLWENFNEELLIGSNKLSIHKKNGQQLVHHRRPSLIFFIEIMKKLFLIGNRASNKRTGVN
ncbi:hypothetical protein LUZ60_007627 [Juncus effusus]|nr:hypothetical protein LUZ60_007627 [Juncus effusus]